jgi:ketosteroid isomerase-like protein
VKNMTAIAAVVIAIALGAGGSKTTDAASDAHAADVAAINAFNQRYLQAINAGDIHALSALTDDDHIMIAPNRTPIVGKAANDEANGRAYQQFNIDEKWAPVETVVDGNLAYQRGTFTVVATPKAGGTARSVKGNFLRIYRRQSGGWQMTRDMFSSDEPPTPPPASK